MPVNATCDKCGYDATHYLVCQDCYSTKEDEITDLEDKVNTLEDEKVDLTDTVNELEKMLNALQLKIIELKYNAT